MRSNQPRAGSLKVHLCSLSALYPYFGSLSVLEWLLYMLSSRKSRSRMKEAQDRLALELDRLRYFSFSRQYNSQSDHIILN